MPPQVVEEQQRPDALVPVRERVVLDHEVEEVRGPRLGAGVQRRPVEGPLDGAQDARQRVAPPLPEQRPGLSPGSQLVVQGGHRGPGLVEGERRARGHGLARVLGQPLLVVLQQEAPGPRVPPDHLEDRLPLSGDQRMAGERPRQERDRLLDLAQAPLGQPPLVQRVATEQVLPQRPGGPDPELRAALGVHPVAD